MLAGDVRFGSFSDIARAPERTSASGELRRTAQCPTWVESGHAASRGRQAAKALSGRSAVKLRMPAKGAQRPFLLECGCTRKQPFRFRHSQCQQLRPRSQTSIRPAYY